MSDTSEGRKFDNDKPRYGLVPYREFKEVVEILTFGSKKYEDDNWKRVPNARSRYFDALERHIAEYKIAIETGNPDGKMDDESGKNHLAHAICNCLFLMWFDNEEKRIMCESRVQDGAYDSIIAQYLRETSCDVKETMKKMMKMTRGHENPNVVESRIRNVMDNNGWELIA